MDLKRIEDLLNLLEERDLNEFVYKDQDLTIKLRFGPNVVSAASVATMVAPAMAGSTSEAVAPIIDDGTTAVESPMVGTFYRAPQPGADFFVDVGQRVEKGTVLCIVEAMKLMNEIEAEISGVIEAILIEDGQPVQFGQAMFKIRPA